MKMMVLTLCVGPKAKLEKSLTFLPSDNNLLGHPTSENLVLNFETPNLLGQLIVLGCC
jgi:hypothetical protein